MNTLTNRRIVLAARPQGAPKVSDFSMISEPVPDLGEGEIFCRTIYFSLDPYMRGRMNEGKSYAAPVEIGETMGGGTVSQVLKSNNPAFSRDDYILTYDGWQEYAVSDGKGARKLDPTRAPISTAVGVLGMPGMTAYMGLLEIGQPQSGETVVVAAATGAVGSNVGQIARLKGCRVVGIAGSTEKCEFAINELGFDACINYKDAGFRDSLKTACPEGIDVYFESVGGMVFEAIIPLLNFQSRIPVCGLIAHYNDTELPSGPNVLPKLMRVVLTQRITIRGFIVSDFSNKEGAFLGDMSKWIADGKIKYKEDIVEGLDNAVGAFQGLLEGKNFGKLLIQVSDDSTR
jgi:NADPH-dependent curcumin reductase CurA